MRICIATVCLVLCSSLSVQGSKGVRAILSVAHVTRHGGETSEIRIYVMRDHQYFREVVDKKQSSTQPNCNQVHGVLSDKGFQLITALKDSPKLQSIRNSSKAIGHHDGELWYIAISRETKTQFLAFSSEDKNTPDVVKNMIAWFEETRKLEPRESLSMRDYQCSIFSDQTADSWRR
jgi:hypothetical protein